MDKTAEASPELRATITHKGGIFMTRCAPWTLQPGGPAPSQIRSEMLAGVFDLTIGRSAADGFTSPTDLIVHDRFLFGNVDTATQALVVWAEGLGYRRTWIGDEVVVLAPRLLGGTWSADCERCGLRWTDSSQEFWLWVRAAGCWPLSCPLCASPLPQPTGPSLPRPRTRTGPDHEYLLFT